MSLLLAISPTAESADDGSAHWKNHLAVIAGGAREKRPDEAGTHSGALVGLEYIRLFKPGWGFGAAFEWVTFNGAQTREGILAFPLSYFPTHNLRLLAAPGIEFRNPGEPEEPMLRLGLGYEFVFATNATMAPEFHVDLLPHGERVYVLALSVGYGF
jgi:hypothetical protein